MTEPYLIAIKSRGQPAFDIAEKMPCPECAASGYRDDAVDQTHCDECDGEGFWWITNAGFRARPYRWWNIDDIYDGSDFDAPKPANMLDTMPPNWPDLFPINATKTKSSPSRPADLLRSLGLVPQAPTVKRRI